jgi:outer membrane autotransporter protein
MNKTYALVWNSSTQSWMVAPETAKNKSKNKSANQSIINSVINNSRIQNKIQSTFQFSLRSLIMSLALGFGFSSASWALSNTDLTQVIDHNTTETGLPAIESVGTNITINLGSSSNLEADEAYRADSRALDVTVQSTSASQSAGITPKATINSAGKVEGMLIKGVSSSQDTPITVNVTGGEVYGESFGIIVDQTQSTANSSITINVDNAVVKSTNPYYREAAIYTKGKQTNKDLVNINVGSNGVLNNESGYAIKAETAATILNNGTIYGSIVIDKDGLVTNNGRWMLGAYISPDVNDSYATQIINNGKIGLVSLDLIPNTTIVAHLTGNITNNNIISLKNGLAGDTININGNLTSSVGSSIELDVVLGNENSAKDLLNITGNTSGFSKVYVTNIGGTGAKTSKGIKVITVGGNSNGTFVLGAPVQVGSYQYLLTKKVKDFYLQSDFPEVPIDPDDQTNNNNNNNNNSNNTTNANSSSTNASTRSNASSTPLVLRPGVIGYAMAKNVNFDTGSALLGQTSSRQQAKSVAKANSQVVWAQSGFTSSSSNAKASVNEDFNLASSSLTSDQKVGFIQFGTNLLSSQSASGASQLNVMAGAAQTNAQLNNPDRTKAGLDAKTGDLESTQANIGLEYQYDFGSGLFVNTVGSISKIRNAFNDVYGATAHQNGTGLSLSIEAGKAIPMGMWSIEPQAQISYQQQRYDAFNDSISSIEGYTASNVRIRTGVKIGQKDLLFKGSEFFTQLDVLQDNSSNGGVSISQETIAAKADNKPWSKIAIGAAYQMGLAQLKAQLAYEKSLTGNAKDGSSFNIAFNLKF